MPIGSNLLKDIRSGQRFLILRTKDPFCVENIIHLFGQKNGEETGIEIDIQITHLIKDHGGLVPGVCGVPVRSHSGSAGADPRTDGDRGHGKGGRS